MLIIKKSPDWCRLVLCRWLLTAMLGCFVTTALAQQTENPDQQGSGEATAGADSRQGQQGMSKEQLLTLIANEIVLAPGVGLRNVRLGEAMDDVRNRLGNASEVTTEGLTRKRLNLVYLLDSGTRIILSGQEVLDRISVYGNASGLVRTAQGARFGMQSRVIRQIYKEPSRSRKTRLEYRQIGATFYLSDDRVNRIDLYPRKS